MSIKVIVATKNQGKIREIKSIFNFENWEILTMKEEGLDPNIVEDGKTFEENSLIKARCVREDYLKNKPQVLKWMLLIKNPEFCRQGIWERILPTVLRIKIS